MTQPIEPTRDQISRALRVLSVLVATSPGAVVNAGPMYVPATGARVSPVVMVILVGAERDAYTAITAAMTHRHEQVFYADRRHVFGQILGVWYCVTAPAAFAPAAVPARQGGPLTPEKVSELIEAGILTRDLRLAHRGVPILPSTDRPLERRFLLHVRETTTTVHVETTEQAG